LLSSPPGSSPLSLHDALPIYGVAAMSVRQGSTATAGPFDRHGGVGETSRAMYLFPTLVQLDKARRAALTLPPDLSKMLPDVVQGDRKSTRLNSSHEWISYAVF